VDWVLFHCGSHFTIGEMEEDPNAVFKATHFVPLDASVPTDLKPNPTAEPAVSQSHLSPQSPNCKSLTRCLNSVSEGLLVEYEVMEGSPVP